MGLNNKTVIVELSEIVPKKLVFEFVVDFLGAPVITSYFNRAYLTVQSIIFQISKISNTHIHDKPHDNKNIYMN